MKRLSFLVAVTAIAICLHAQVPANFLGTIKRVDSFASKYVAARTIAVWLPEGYDSTKRYPVLYMHDGQNLFDSTVTFNHQ
ncbi:MAG TPA: alpha/beta hydrolase-fold protein, partial [Cyclobacteriaceae bacterium]|nr:alpha/beta hydrolase-fold protein [Cyclobacteriaceae bacterium]